MYFFSRDFWCLFISLFAYQGLRFTPSPGNNRALILGSFLMKEAIVVIQRSVV